MSDIEVYVGEYKVAKDSDNLTASGIGSCMVTTLFDPKLNIGAMSHSMLTAQISEHIDEMLSKLCSLGSSRGNIEAKLVGGANMFPALESNIGMQNVLSAKEKLKKEGIKLCGEAVGGSVGRSAEFCTASGIVTVKMKL